MPVPASIAATWALGHRSSGHDIFSYPKPAQVGDAGMIALSPISAYSSAPCVKTKNGASDVHLVVSLGMSLPRAPDKQDLMVEVTRVPSSLLTRLC